jgi:hypothetical protein
MRLASFSLASALCIAVFLVACDAPTGPSDPRIVRVDPAWVTGAAAAAVDPVSRLFAISPSGESALTRAGADSAALASIRLALHPGTVGNGRSSLESDRGAPVAAWNEMSVCGRAMRVESPFGAPLDTAPRNLRRFLSSAWVHTICGPRGDAQVAMHTTDVRTGIRFNGADYVIADLDSIGQVHLDSGIPVTGGVVPWPSPEEVLRRLFELTGVPISQVPQPQLHWYPPITVAWIHMWRLELSAQITGQLEDGGTAPPFSTIFARLDIGDSIAFYVPEETQPSVIWAPFPVSFEPFVEDSVAFPVIKPIIFRRVWLVASQSAHQRGIAVRDSRSDPQRTRATLDTSHPRALSGPRGL